MKNAVKDKTFILVSNFHTYGIQHGLKDYLVSHGAGKVYFLNHPLHGVSSDLYSTLELFTGKKHKVIRKIKRRKFLVALNYLLDFFITLYLVFSYIKDSDVYVGFNSMNTLAGSVFKLLRKIKFLITYSHSYKKQGHQSYFLDEIYRLIDGIAVRSSDSVWGLGKGLIRIRKSQGVSREKIVYVPDGVDTKLFRSRPYSAERRFKLIFVGLINEINGLELVVDAMPSLLRWNKSLTLDIVGDGEKKEQISEKVNQLGIEKSVKFHGILSIEKLAELLPKFGIGIATYKPLRHSTLKTTDPMKTKLYMASGLPIVSTDIYATAHEIKDYRLGALVKYDVGELVRAVKKIIKEENYKRMRDNSVGFVKKYDWNSIFDGAFAKTSR